MRKKGNESVNGLEEHSKGKDQNSRKICQKLKVYHSHSRSSTLWPRTILWHNSDASLILFTASSMRLNIIFMNFQNNCKSMLK